MESFFQGLQGAIDTVAKYAFVLTVIGLFLIFNPWAQEMSLEKFRDDNISELWLMVLIAGGISLQSGFVSALPSIKGAFSRYRAKRDAEEAATTAAHEAKTKRDAERGRIRRQFSTLSEGEKMLVAYCVKRNQQTVGGYVGFAPVDGLCTRGLLREGQGVRLDKQFYFPDEVWEVLQAMRDQFMPSDKQLAKIEQELHRMAQRY